MENKKATQPQNNVEKSKQDMYKYTNNNKQTFATNTRELQGKSSKFFISPSNITNTATLVASLTFSLTLYLQIIN